MAGLLAPGALDAADVVWLPECGAMRFIADPFGLWRDGRLHLFVETYDYRDRHGAIEAIVLDEALRVVERRPVLREPWHLSYPFVFESEGETYMLPEAHRSGGLTLYRAVEFPWRWAPVRRLDLGVVPIDATPLFHEGRWWLFFTVAGSRADKVSALHLAYADALEGPWTLHPANPVRIDPSSARPGGTPVVTADGVVLPVQDCTRTYGGAIRPLRIGRLDPEGFEAVAGEALGPPRVAGRFDRGLHTLSSAGGVTLLDAKRQEVSPLSLALDGRRALTRSLRRRT
jgi:hypothetical protein